MITISGDWLRANWQRIIQEGFAPLPLSRWDGGDAFTLSSLGPLSNADQVLGSVLLPGGRPPTTPVWIELVSPVPDTTRGGAFVAPNGISYAPMGYSLDGAKRQHQVSIVEVAPTLAERRRVLLESSALEDAKVAVFGLGTGGISVALELAKAGVGNFWVVDGERLEVGNVSRHHAGLSHVGRLKALVARDLILEKNPYAIVHVSTRTAGVENEEEVRGSVREVDLVVGATDGRPSKLFINRLCVQETKPVIFGGAFRRAYGGQVLRVRPRISPCYQCFVMAMPEEESDIEIASPREAEDVAYADRPVPIEPGLSLDVGPIALMVAKLSLTELLRNRDSALRMLERDLAAPWYLWMNRPEPGTKAAGWPPLSESADEMTILRWYGIEFERTEGCPVCGDFTAAITARYGEFPDILPGIPSKKSDVHGV